MGSNRGGGYITYTNSFVTLYYHFLFFSFLVSPFTLSIVFIFSLTRYVRDCREGKKNIKMNKKKQKRKRED